MHGVDPDMVLAGNGSDDLLTIITRACAGPGDPVACPSPSYILYRTLVELQDGRTLRARSFVASTVDVPQTFKRMVGLDQLPADYVQRVESFKHTGDLTLPGRRSEAMAIDRAGKKMYVNLTDEVGVVDLPARKLTARWPVPDAHVQNAMALDEPHHRLFIATRNPPKLFVFDADTGKVINSYPCVGVNDDMTFDTKRKKIYITGDGATSVFEQRDADNYEHIVDVPTGFRAKTSLYVPELNRLYINVSGGEKADAPVALQIYQVQP